MNHVDKAQPLAVSSCLPCEAAMTMHPGGVGNRTCAGLQTRSACDLTESARGRLSSELPRRRSKNASGQGEDARLFLQESRVGASLTAGRNRLCLRMPPHPAHRSCRRRPPGRHRCPGPRLPVCRGIAGLCRQELTADSASQSGAIPDFAAMRPCRASLRIEGERIEIRES
jgi:hypothetical protein